MDIFHFTIYYFTLENFAIPLLFLGIFLALYQFAHLEARGSIKIVRWLIKRTKVIWGILAAILGFWVVYKSIPTAIGWGMHMLGADMWLKVDLSKIDDRVGIGSIVVLVIVIYLVIRGLIDCCKKGEEQEK